MAKRERYNTAEVLENWRVLMKALPNLTEEELSKALKFELHNERRKDFVNRLHRRYCKLRQERELKEYLGET